MSGGEGGSAAARPARLGLDLTLRMRALPSVHLHRGRAASIQNGSSLVSAAPPCLPRSYTRIVGLQGGLMAFTRAFDLKLNPRGERGHVLLALLPVPAPCRSAHAGILVA